MSVLSDLSKMGSLIGEAKAVTASPDFIQAFMMPPVKSGVNVNHTSAMSVMALYRAVIVVAQSISQLPCEVYKIKDGDEKVDTEHPLYALMRWRPSLNQDSVQFMTTMLIHAVCTGNALAVKTIDKGQIEELLPIVPLSYEIRIDPENGRKLYDVGFYDGTMATLYPDQVVHITGPSWDTMSGMDPTKAGREAIGIALAAEGTHASFHKNAARPSGLLTTDNTGVDEALANRIRAMWSAAAQGGDNTGMTPFLTGGVKWTSTRMTGVDAEHMETRRFQIEEMARLVGVFPMLLGHADQNMTAAAMDSLMKAHVKFTVQPWLATVTMALNTQLLGMAELKKGYVFKIDSSELMRGSPAERALYYKEALGNSQQPGWLSQNEVRNDDGWGRLPGLDEVMKPTPAMANKDPAAQISPAPSPRRLTDQRQKSAEKRSALRTLYVHRKLLNSEAIYKWAKGQGIENVRKDLRVTIMYSRDMVDHLDMGDAWDEEIRIPPGGPRVVEFMEGTDALAIKFRSTDLEWRHEQMVERGANPTFTEYQPLVTIALGPQGVDLRAIAVYQGELRFGPEIFGEIEE